jgi:hypothetical protein
VVIRDLATARDSNTDLLLSPFVQSVDLHLPQPEFPSQTGRRVVTRGDVVRSANPRPSNFSRITSPSSSPFSPWHTTSVPRASGQFSKLEFQKNWCTCIPSLHATKNALLHCVSTIPLRVVRHSPSKKTANRSQAEAETSFPRPPIEFDVSVTLGSDHLREVQDFPE